MRYIVFILLLYVSSVYSAQVVPLTAKYQGAEDCEACHYYIVRKWRHSWHAKSHYRHDEYYRATVNYVSRKTRQNIDAVKIECATCHNPRIAVTKTNFVYSLDKIMGLHTPLVKKVDKAVHDSKIREGINCVVCHNIDKIHSDLNASFRGINRVTWLPQGIMSGPFKDAISPYHKTVYKKFMSTNPNELCFVCHANDHTVKGKVFTDMQQQYKGSKQTCVSCHMGPKKELYASSLRIDHGKPRPRMIREHTFIGAHTPSMWRNALHVRLQKKENTLAITLINNLPHNIPSGFGAREIRLEITYKNGEKTIGREYVSLTRHYTSQWGRVTIPHLGVKASPDMSVPAHGTKTVKVSLKKGVTAVHVDVYYLLVNKQVRKLLDLKEPIWSQKMFITDGWLRGI